LITNDEPMDMHEPLHSLIVFAGGQAAVSVETNAAGPALPACSLHTVINTSGTSPDLVH